MRYSLEYQVVSLTERHKRSVYSFDTTEPDVAARLIKIEQAGFSLTVIKLLGLSFDVVELWDGTRIYRQFIGEDDELDDVVLELVSTALLDMETGGEP